MAWDRRTVLKSLLAGAIAQAGLAWGEGCWPGSSAFFRYRQVLAAPTQRKLALLVGINHYAEGSELRGCLTDVELQREVLIHRFGFNPADILSLTGAAATREAIATAFLEHLVAQSKAGDGVLFHFSGYGHRVRLGDQPPLAHGLVPSDGLFDGLFDGQLPPPAQPVVNSLLAGTLDLLVRSLLTDQVTLVLDTSYQPSLGNLQGNLQGNLRGRSLSSAPTLPSLEELALQSQLRHRLMIPGAVRDSPAKGVILQAAQSEQVATEIALNGAFCGLFTYALTQTLWAMTPARRLYFILTRTAEQMAPLRGNQQQPTLTASGQAPWLTYGLDRRLGAVGLVTQLLDETTLEFKWVGLPRAVLLAYGLNSILMPSGEGSREEAPVLVQLRSQNGLTAIARILNPTPESLAALAPGQGLQEMIRIIPRKQGLILALDAGLERIERVDATSALSTIKAIAAIVSPGEGFADCILAAVNDSPPSKNLTTEAENAVSLMDKSRYGLFNEGGVKLPNTLGKKGEAIKSAVGRLEPHWNRLLAVKLWNLTQNENSTRLKVRATLEVGSPTLRPLISKASQRQSLSPSDLTPKHPALASNEPLLPQLSPGSLLRFRLENNDVIPLYYCLLGLNGSSQAIAHFPWQQAPDEQAAPAIAPGETVLIPTGDDPRLPWQGSPLSGLEQWLIVFTRQPCQQVIAVLAQAEEMDLKSSKNPFGVLSNPQGIAQALLMDLHQISQVDLATYNIPADPESSVLDLQAWASLSFVYQVG